MRFRRAQPRTPDTFLREAYLHGHLVTIESSGLCYHPGPGKFTRKVLVDHHAHHFLPNVPPLRQYYMLHHIERQTSDTPRQIPSTRLHPTLMGITHRGTRCRMAPKTERIQFLRAERQLRRIRSFYAAAMALWAGSAAWTGWQAPGSRQMWVSVLLLAVFTVLLATASLSLRRLAVPATGRPAHYAAPHKAPATRRHAPA